MAQGSSNPTADIKKLAGYDINTNIGSANNGTQRVVLATDQTSIPVISTQSTVNLSGVQITNNSGAFSCSPVSSPVLVIGATVAITGSAAGTGSISNYSSGLIYKISVTNGIDSFTLTNLDGTALTTTSGTPTGLTYTLNTANFINNLAQLAGQNIAMGTGVRSAGTQRVTIATDDVVPASQSGTWNVGLNAGTNGIGKLTANSGVTIGAVEIAPSQTLATVTNLSQLGGVAVAMGTGVRSAGTQRVTIATDDVVPASQSGTWNVGLNAGTNAIGKLASNTGVTIGAVEIASSQTISVTQATASNLNATVTGTVELGATSLAALENISVTVPGTVDLGTISLTSLETITVTSDTAGNLLSKVYGAVTTAAPSYTNSTDNALSLTTSGSLRVDVMSSLPAGTNGIGKLTSNSGVTIGAVEIAASQTLSTVTTVGSVTSITNALPSGTNTIGKLEPNSPATGPNSNVTTSTLASSLQIKSSAGTLFMLNGYNNKASSQFIQIHNSTAPSGGAAPVITFTVPANSNFSFDFGIYGRYFSTGIYVVNSSTVATYTAGSADCWFDAQYK